MALCKVEREETFVTQGLDALNEKYKKPVEVHVENNGSIFLTQKSNSSKNTKDIDLMY
jgi:hypothetical protein